MSADDYGQRGPIDVEFLDEQGESVGITYAWAVPRVGERVEFTIALRRKPTASAVGGMRTLDRAALVTYTAYT